MARRKTLWIVLLALVLAGGAGYGGYLAYKHFFGQTKVAATTTLQTATVTLGSLSISSSGSGTLIPGTEMSIGFSSAGTLTELRVKVGDKVQAGDVLARIDATDAQQAVDEAQLQVAQAEATLANQKDPTTLQQAVTQAELKEKVAEANLASAQLNLNDLLNWTPDTDEVKLAEISLNSAQVDYQRVVARSQHKDDELLSPRMNLDQAISAVADAQDHYAQVMDAARDFDRNIADQRNAAAESLAKAQNNLKIAQYTYDMAVIDAANSTDVQSAWAKVINAQTALENAKTGPTESEITTARIAVQQAEVSLAQAKLDLDTARKNLTDLDTTQAELSLTQARDKLESAQETLEKTTLTAPISGVVTAVSGQVGEAVASGSFITLADLDQPRIEFWIEESELKNVAIGNTISIVFTAFPDLTYTGKIISVEPLLVTVGNTPAVQAWASIDLTSHPISLLGNMNADIEVVAAEAKNVPLVPVTALRQVSTDQYAVFVVQADGQLELRPVVVGIKDYVNAEIRSGLQPGEVVSLGQKQSTTVRATSTPSAGGGPQFFGPGGGGFPPD
jgi:multidrug efflux pump subunit AcrA (membrane-fusion protein)